jgi:hypothetical protein
MRQETNNEMDLLLRRLGRQDSPASSDHLDADELNSYAENVLPPTARARYTEHLAECARCRDLVVQLSSSAGVVIAPETAKISEPSALRKFLASLFSPMVLRFAVPALGLVVVAAIGFMVTRNEGSLSPVAEVRDNQPAQISVPASQPQPSSSPEGVSSGFLDTTKSLNKAEAKGDTAAETGAAAPPPPNAAPVVSTITTDGLDAAKKADQQQVNEKEAAALPKATPAISELKKVDPEVQKQPATDQTVVANEPPAEKAKTQDRSDADVAKAAPGAARNRAERRDITSLAGASTQSAKREDDAEKDKKDADTRTVAGRRFRKEGSVWIDTDFSSSRVVISVARGSEQYRGLVADEPAIKQIADTLDGEILVVWKGRAYRIR